MICLQCLGSQDGYCPQHPASGGAEPVEEGGLLNYCPTCGGRVLIVQDEEGTAHYIPLWAEGAERLLRLILENEAADCNQFVGRTVYEP